MIANIGYLLLLVGVVSSALAALICLQAMLRKKPAAISETRLLTALATLAISAAFLLVISVLVAGRFNFEIVFDNTSRQMNLLQRVTAVWGNKSGSLLFWSFLLTISITIIAFGKWKSEKEPYFNGVLFLLQVFNLFFVALITFRANPFSRLWQLPTGNVVASVFAPPASSVYTPLDGQGLNPLLKHLGMVIHPPLLYLGFIFFFIPYAYALVSLWRRDYSYTWLKHSRVWITLAWIFLGAGILLGCWWAYDILGWGGYWGWDPVEVAGLMPWLSALGLLHSLEVFTVSQRARRWAYWQIILTVILIIFGIYLSRTGVVSSVHAYSTSSIGIPFMFFFIALLVVSLVSLLMRGKDLQPDEQPKRMLSRPGLSRILSLCLTALVVISLVGVTLPLTTGLFYDEPRQASQALYEWNFAPFLLVILVITALGFIPRGKKSMIVSIVIAALCTLGIWILIGSMTLPAFLGFGAVFFLIAALLLSVVDRLKRGKGGSRTAPSYWASILLHLGFALLALGVIGSRNLAETNILSLEHGQSVQLGEWTITKQAEEVSAATDEQVLYMEEYQFSQDDQATPLYPRILWYEDTGSTVSSPAIHSALDEDIYAAILEWDGVEQGDTIVLLSYFPLMIWLWIGGVLMLLGAFLYLFYPLRSKD